MIFTGIGLISSSTGLPISANLSSFPRKVVFSYIPTAIGMAAEPIFITIAICQCMIAPYAMLTRGAPTSSKSLAVDFDKSPPHFQIVRSLRTRNVPLAALTLSILLCNVLTVALAGLFTITQRPLDNTEVTTYPDAWFMRGISLPEQEMYHVLAEQLSGRGDALPFTTPEYYIIPVLADPRVTVERFEAPAIGIGLDLNCRLVPEKNVLLDCVDRFCEQQVSGSKELPYEYTASVDDPCWNPLEQLQASPSEMAKISDYHWKGLSHDNMVQTYRCENAFFPLWVERSSIPRLPGSANLTNGNRYLDSLFMHCEVYQKTVQLNIVVSKNSRLQNVSAVRSLNPEEIYRIYRASGNNTAAKSFLTGIDDGLRTRNTLDHHKMRWMNYLMKLIEPKIVRNTTYRSHIPDKDHVVSAFEDVYRRLFVIFLKLAEDKLLELGKPQTIVVKATVTAWRVDVSLMMYCLAGSIILVMVVVLVLLYWHRQQKVVYLPTTLAGLYALLYASNAKEECGELYGRDPAERARNLQDVGGLYACGPFADGEHYGVHRTGKLADPETEAERPLLEEEN